MGYLFKWILTFLRYIIIGFIDANLSILISVAIDCETSTLISSILRSVNLVFRDVYINKESMYVCICCFTENFYTSRE
jgi:hypothetical protein